MRVIEKEMLSAIRERKQRNLGNTIVSIYGDMFSVSLHGNTIARGHYHNGLPIVTLITCCGWWTNTTASRLRALGYVGKRNDMPYTTQSNVNYSL